MKSLGNKAIRNYQLEIMAILLLPLIASGGLVYLAFKSSTPVSTILAFVLLISGLLVAVKAPGITFALFLTAGFYKAEASIYLPRFIDLTVLFGVLTVLGIAIRICRNKFRIPRIPNKFLLPYIGLVLMMIASLFYTGAPNYGTDKLLRFSILTTFATFGPMFLFTNLDQFKRFSYTLIIVSIAGVIDACIESTGMFHTAFGSNYIALGRISGLASLLAAYYFFTASSPMKKLFWVTVALVNLFGLLYSGARGPVVALIGTLGVILLLSVKWKLKKATVRIIKGMGVLILVIGLLVVIYPNEFSTLRRRMEFILPGGGLGRSAIVRLQLYNEAVSAIMAAPLIGQGIGGFSKYALGIDARAYPHDIILEIGAELGIIGLALFIALITFCFAQILRIRRNSSGRNYYLATLLLALFVFAFLNALVSGDINDNRLFFIWIGAIYAFALWSKKEGYAQYSLHPHYRSPTV